MSSFTPQQIEEFLQEFFDVVGARQYVGARYVPIFGRAGEDTIEWDDLAPYEPLTVVMYEGVSYVSRRYVPTGIPIANTDYWAETYRFNAQVEQYRQEVLRFQTQIDQIREDYVPFPDAEIYPKYGIAGQVLTTLEDGTTKWNDPVVPSDAQAEAIITEWLDEHPEATTTVTDGSITLEKLYLLTFNSLSDIRFILPYGGYAAISITNNTLTIPNATVVCGSRYYHVLDSDAVVDLTATSSSAKKIVFDLVAHTFKCYSYSSNTGTRSEAEFMVIKYGNAANTRVDTSVPYTINGQPYGLDVPPLIATNTLDASKLLDNTMDVSKLTMAAYSILQSPQVILPAGRYVNIDIPNQTVTFPNDCIIVGSTYRYVLTGDAVVDLTATTSSAKKIGFDMVAHTFSCTAYSSFVDRTNVCLMALRMGTATATRVDASFPYSINNVPYGIPIPEQATFEQIISYPPQHVKSVNHRGYSDVAPENTIPAYVMSKQHGFAYVECDLQWTSDDVGVLLHDGTINRTARNADGTTIGETISISDITYAEALEYDFGIWKGEQFAGTRIPTLEQFMKVCRDLSLKPYIETKGGLTTAHATDMIGIIKRYGMLAETTHISASPSDLNVTSALESGLRLGLVTNTTAQSDITFMLGLGTSNGSEVFIDANVADTGAGALCLQNDIALEVWTVNATSIATIDDYVTGITSNQTIAAQYYYNQYIGL